MVFETPDIGIQRDCTERQPAIFQNNRYFPDKPSRKISLEKRVNGMDISTKAWDYDVSTNH